MAVVLVLALVGAACSRDDNKESGSDSTTTNSAPAASSTGAFGDVGTVCKDGSASGAPAQGVTADTIKVGTFSDPGFAGRPGLNQELFDTAEVFADWCNAAGGINGRKIEIEKQDAALTNVKARMTDACSTDFFEVGGGAVFDQDGVETRLACLLPEVAGYSVSPEARGADLNVQPVPNPIQTFPVGDLNFLEKQSPDAAQRYGILTGDIGTTKLVADQYKEAASQLKWKKVYDDVYPPAGVTDWTPYAQGIKEKGTKGLIWVGEPENLASLMKALAAINYELDWVATSANHYDQKLIDLAGPALKDSVYVRSAFNSFEDAKKGSATQQYLDAFAKYKPDGKNKTYLGLQSWSAFLLFAKAASQCGDNVTRKCVYDNAAKITEWTGGGLHAKQNVVDHKGGNCFTLEQATASGFKVVNVKPNDGIFNCSSANVVTLKGDYGKGVTLADVGKTQADFK